MTPLLVLGRNMALSNRRNLPFITLLTVTLFMACAGGGLSKVNRHTATVGEGSLYNVQRSARRILDQYHYDINRYEEYTTRIYIETIWKDHNPLEDEEAAGVSAVQTRLILEATPKMRDETSGREMNRMKFTGEVLVRLGPAGDWLELAMTPMRKAYFKQCADDLKYDLRAAIRKF